MTIAKIGAPRIEGTDTVAGKTVPALFFGDRKINNNYDVVDALMKIDLGGPRRRGLALGHGVLWVLGLGAIGLFAGKYFDFYWDENVRFRPEVIEALGDLNARIANDKHFVATRLAHKLDLTGPAVAVGTTCSTSRPVSSPRERMASKRASKFLSCISRNCMKSLRNNVNKAA